MWGSVVERVQNILDLSKSKATVSVIRLSKSKSSNQENYSSKPSDKKKQNFFVITLQIIFFRLQLTQLIQECSISTILNNYANYADMNTTLFINSI